MLPSIVAFDNNPTLVISWHRWLHRLNHEGRHVDLLSLFHTNFHSCVIRIQLRYDCHWFARNPYMKLQAQKVDIGDPKALIVQTVDIYDS